jgi:hypothetical protein
LEARKLKMLKENTVAGQQVHADLDGGVQHQIHTQCTQSAVLVCIEFAAEPP